MFFRKPQRTSTNLATVDAPAGDSSPTLDYCLRADVSLQPSSSESYPRNGPAFFALYLPMRRVFFLNPQILPHPPGHNRQERRRPTSPLQKWQHANDTMDVDFFSLLPFVARSVWLAMIRTRRELRPPVVEGGCHPSTRPASRRRLPCRSPHDREPG